MSVQSLSSNAPILDLFKQRRDAMQSMESAVQSGDLTTAQQSLSQVQAATQTLQGGQNQQSPSDGAPNNPYASTLKADLTSLMSAVQSGDLAGAQSALQQFQTDKGNAPWMSNATQSQSQNGSNPSSAPSFLEALAKGSQSGASGLATFLQADAVPPSGGASNSGTTGSNSFITDFTSLLSALSSGNTSGAASSAATLQNDLQSLLGSTSSPTAASGPSAGNSSSFLTDLQSLIGAAQSSNTAGAQQAAGNLASDLQNAIIGLINQAGGHHHHHHGMPAPAANSSTQSAPATPGASASDPDGDGDAAGNMANGAGALNNIVSAYQALASYADTAPTSNSPPNGSQSGTTL